MKSDKEKIFQECREWLLENKDHKDHVSWNYLNTLLPEAYRVQVNYRTPKESLKDQE